MPFKSVHFTKTKPMAGEQVTVLVLPDGKVPAPLVVPFDAPNVEFALRVIVKRLTRLTVYPFQ